MLLVIISTNNINNVSIFLSPYLPVMVAPRSPDLNGASRGEWGLFVFYLVKIWLCDSAINFPNPFGDSDSDNPDDIA